MLWPQSSATDETQVGLILSLPSGESLACSSPLLETSSPLLGKLEEFIRARTIVFDNLYCTWSAKSMLLGLRRGTGCQSCRRVLMSGSRH
ncbi:WD repeat-containing protein 26 [Platysternon megacephalum]|uniref:WD repeat-containing protein 26 n=1 Tax=Platysternon megacephalum TaxID=55544 RepID=A0A4D9EQ87_9SAUR|nr:WD repeat-containing protein 26 [Platysternon megacephalum]